jgi:hypothetical protein
MRSQQIHVSYIFKTTNESEKPMAKLLTHTAHTHTQQHRCAKTQKKNKTMDCVTMVLIERGTRIPLDLVILINSAPHNSTFIPEQQEEETLVKKS